MEMKSRRYFLFLVLAGAGCRGSHQKDLLPMTLGEFRRIAVENVPAEEHAPDLKKRGLKQARRAIYQRSGRFTVTVNEMGAQAVAFEMVQRWKPESRKIVFHEGPYFVVLESESNDAAGMNALAAALEGSLKQ
jgi:hypothetical protein